MEKVFVEENGMYCIDCTKSVWATDEINKVFHTAGVQLKDVDFLIESQEKIYMVEYKNASVKNAVNPNAFHPEEDKKINTVVQKFYDSLHYLFLTGKKKPVSYIYILEYPNGDIVTRKRLRNKLKQRLPFSLQDEIGQGRKLIEKIEVLSIDEWNHNEEYALYPIREAVNEN